MPTTTLLLQAIDQSNLLHSGQNYNTKTNFSFIFDSWEYILEQIERQVDIGRN